MVRHVHHFDRVAQVGLVGAVFAQGFDIGDQRPVGIDAAAAPERLEQPLDHRLHGGKHVLLLDEGHLDVELVEIGRAAVGAGVFVPEAGRDLEIAVEACDHDQLLELLRGLRQRIELARMQARWHQEIARPLGRGRRDDRGLELGETGVPHRVAQPFDDPAAQHDVVVKALAPQVEEAIGEARFLGVILLAEDGQRQIIRGAEDVGRGRIDLDLAGGQPGIDQARIAPLHAPLDADDGFRAQPFQQTKGRAVAVGDDLGDAVMVAQVDEQHAPMVAHPVHPARQAHLGPGVGGGQLAAGMAAIGVHGASPLFRGRINAAPPALSSAGRA